jgi:hypothetical protein
MANLNVGDIFIIPFKDKYIIGKILWISKRTKNVFSFIIFSKLFDDINNININSLNETNAKIKLFTGYVEVFYTSVKIFEDKNWKIIGNSELTDIENTKLQFHNVGGNLYKGDEYIKALNKEELIIYPKMLSAGYEAIYNMFDKIFEKMN